MKRTVFIAIVLTIFALPAFSQVKDTGKMIKIFEHVQKLDAEMRKKGKVSKVTKKQRSCLENHFSKVNKSDFKDMPIKYSEFLNWVNTIEIETWKPKLAKGKKPTGVEGISVMFFALSGFKCRIVM